MALEQTASQSSSAATGHATVDQSELKREEISKLLLLVSKAAQNGYISEEQKGYESNILLTCLGQLKDAETDTYFLGLLKMKYASEKDT